MEWVGGVLAGRLVSGLTSNITVHTSSTHRSFWEAAVVVSLNRTEPWPEGKNLMSMCRDLRLQPAYYFLTCLAMLFVEHFFNNKTSAIIYYLVVVVCFIKHCKECN